MFGRSGNSYSIMAGLSYTGLVTQIRNYTEVDSNVLTTDILESIILNAQYRIFRDVPIDADRKIGTGNDETCAGILHLFDPANTTFVKHFISRAFAYQNISAQYNADNFGAGYCNVTAAIDGVQFAMSSGNIDSGTIKMYGIK